MKGCVSGFCGICLGVDAQERLPVGWPKELVIGFGLMKGIQYVRGVRYEYLD